MSRTKRNFQHHCSGIKAGRDGYWGNRGQYGYWSRRPLSGYNPSHKNKIMCNRVERRRIKPDEIEFAIAAEDIGNELPDYLYTQECRNECLDSADDFTNGRIVSKEQLYNKLGIE